MESSATSSATVTKSQAVHLAGVTKSFGTIKVLDGVDLDVGAGELMTLLGPSGSGKTSTLMAVAGFLQPDSGSITVGSRDVTHLPPGRARDMGIVFQNYALFPHLTVAENIAYPLKIRGLPRADVKKRVDEMLDLVQLGPLSERKPARLSGGQQQRVALARALAFSPSVLLMDEPMGALDVRLKEELQWEIRKLQREIGATILYVTHDQTEAMVLSDRICLMDAGRIEQVDEPRQIYQSPKSVFAARFLGESNLLPARYVNGGGLKLDGSGLVCGVKPPPGATDGAAYIALMRPEFLTLTADEGASDDGMSFTCPGTVVDAVFVGQTVRFEVKTSLQSEPLLVQLPSVQAVAGIHPGAAVQVACRSEHIHLISDDKHTGTGQ